jgi:hypothetical protein
MKIAVGGSEKAESKKQEKAIPVPRAEPFE